MSLVGRWIATAALVILVGPGLAMAEPQMLGKVKSLGLPAQNCQYCHTDKIPKKESFTPAELNDRGAWLLADTAARKSKTIELERLKDYPGGQEQK